ncbi:MAG: hypothetical protein BGO25_19400 [Acidobacteriales bacterium 59-55]|nr:hypothetical protein [Terriglobales bacterium]OJV41810.1 MAG: hypothetical protein BGO25_19400 [Acidobacteriales bacterium 59-55]
MSTPLQVLDNKNTQRIAMERQSQWLVSAFIVTGIFFMLLPGTFLGVWNLLDISEAHLSSALPQAWLQAHGQAQIFGWIGSFIIGIGLYSLTKTQSTMIFPTRIGWSAWTLWTLGIALRWTAGIVLWHWRILLPVSGLLQLIAFLLFFYAVRRHGPKATTSKPEPWMRMVVASTICFLLTLAVNFVVLLRQGITGATPALPHVLDQVFVVLAVWGIIVPTVWGFNARWLPIFAGLRPANGDRLLWAYGLSLAGLVFTFFDFLAVASVAFFFAALLSIDALHVWRRSIHPPKLLNIHPSFPIFVRLAYVWLIISCVLALLAVPFDHAGGLWGASRHALTVGFAAGMVFVIGPRILPAFCGMKILWSKRLMFWSLLLLTTGCFLRVSSEPLAYENLWKPAWKVLPVSAIIELTAVSLFAINIVVTLLLPAAHLRTGEKPSLPQGKAAQA